MDIYSNLLLEPKPNGNFKLKKDYDLGFVKVPNGYETNGGNVPKPFRGFVSRYSPKYLPMYVVHDYYCSLGYIYYKKGLPLKTVFNTFDKADRLLLEVGKLTTVNKFMVTIIYLSVRFYNKFIRKPKLYIDKKINKK